MLLNMNERLANLGLDMEQKHHLEAQLVRECATALTRANAALVYVSLYLDHPIPENETKMKRAISAYKCSYW